MEGSFATPGHFSLDIIEEGRRDIYKWGEKRRSKRSGFHGALYKTTKLFITRSVCLLPFSFFITFYLTRIVKFHRIQEYVTAWLKHYNVEDDV